MDAEYIWICALVVFVGESSCLLAMSICSWVEST